MSYGALWRARFRLLRPGNGLMATVAVLLGAAVAMPLGPAFPWSLVLAAMLAAFLITGFGNVVNDVIDRDIDAQAHPDRPIPSGAITVEGAIAFAMLLVGFGLWEAWVAGGTTLLAFAGVNALLLLAYAKWWKGVAVLGNVVVAALVASAFWFGHLVTGYAGPSNLIGFSAMAFMTNVGRELFKDIEDRDSDVGRRTLAQISPSVAAWMGRAVVIAAVAASLWLAIPVSQPPGLAAPDWWTGPAWYEAWRAGIIAASGWFVFALTRSEPGRVRRHLKSAMLLALVSYGAAALLA